MRPNKGASAVKLQWHTRPTPCFPGYLGNLLRGGFEISCQAARLELAHRFDQFEPRPYGPLGVVLMGSGITKIHEGTVPHVSRHETIEAVHGLGNAFLIG